jgi:hypothetical protein
MGIRPLGDVSSDRRHRGTAGSDRNSETRTRDVEREPQKLDRSVGQIRATLVPARDQRHEHAISGMSGRLMVSQWTAGAAAVTSRHDRPY